MANLYRIKGDIATYHPSRAHKERWEKLAAKAHTSLSKFIISIVDGVIDEKEELAPRHVRELGG
jgi:hypothetical protein